MGAPPSPGRAARGLVFATLGPEASNHVHVARRYLDFHGLRGEVAPFPDFGAAFAALLSGAADHVLQAAVHPETAACVGRYRDRAFLVDAFVSPGLTLALVRRREAIRPRSLGLMPATRSYVDVARYERLVEVAATPLVAAGLLAGEYEAGITTLEAIEGQADALAVEEVLGTVDDAWLVYGRQRLTAGERLLACRDGPAARLYEEEIARRG